MTVHLENQAHLTRRLSAMIMPTTSEHAGHQPIVTTYTHQVAESLNPYQVVPHDPMSPVIRKTGMMTRRSFEKLVNALRSGDAN